MPRDVREVGEIVSGVGGVTLVLEDVGVVGSGWYGEHTALTLGKKGHGVTVLEAKKHIHSGISGKFGTRAHEGQHYTRSPETRDNCRAGSKKFQEAYPQFIYDTEYSTYGLGTLDADNLPSRITPQQFAAVCSENDSCQAVDLTQRGYQNLHVAYDVAEQGIVIGKRVREFFEKQFEEVGVEVKCNFRVTQIVKGDGYSIIINDQQEQYAFKHVVNTTSFQALLPSERLPFSIEVVYQPVVALLYTDNKPTSDKPFSFTVMDGWFPCLMPYDNRPTTTKEASRNYILTHCKWGILGTYQNASEAQQRLSIVNDDFISQQIKPRFEGEMIRFWPEFVTRFTYQRWVGAAIAKPNTKKDFRSALTFKCNNIINVIPGKVTNIFDVAEEIDKLIEEKNVIHEAGFSYVKGGTLDTGFSEVIEKPIDKTRSTGYLQPYAAFPNTTNILDEKSMPLAKMANRVRSASVLQPCRALLPKAPFLCMANYFRWFKNRLSGNHLGISNKWQRKHDSKYSKLTETVGFFHVNSHQGVLAKKPKRILEESKHPRDDKHSRFVSLRMTGHQ